MAVSRYKFVSKVANDLEEFEDLLENRRKAYIVQHKTRRLAGYNRRLMRSVNNVFHTWKQADRYWKLADRYYNDARYWWVIAEWNQRPTESYVENGDVILIPTPVAAALSCLGY